MTADSYIADVGKNIVSKEPLNAGSSLLYLYTELE